MCLADITTDNPNVWFELGFAISAKKEVVLLCARDRTTRFPFDVQHRSIIQYETESPSDFERLSKEITARIKALIVKERTVDELASSSPLKEREGLQPFQIATLALVLANCPHPETAVSIYALRNDMERAGYTHAAFGLGIRSLLELIYITSSPEEDYETRETYQVIGLTDRGFKWLISHQNELQIYLEPKTETLDVLPDEPPF